MEVRRRRRGLRRSVRGAGEGEQPRRPGCPFSPEGASPTCQPGSPAPSRGHCPLRPRSGQRVPPHEGRGRPCSANRRPGGSTVSPTAAAGRARLPSAPRGRRHGSTAPRLALPSAPPRAPRARRCRRRRRWAHRGPAQGESRTWAGKEGEGLNATELLSSPPQYRTGRNPRSGFAPTLPPLKNQE